MARLLASEPMTARQLAAALLLRERDVIGHLEHLQRSLRRGPERLVVEPPACHGCDYRYPGRQRLSTPGSCPRCRGRRIDPPVFAIEGDPGPGR